jgi:hypothetical protein
LLGRKIAGFLAGRQVGVIASLGPGVLRLLTPLPLGSLRVALGIIEIIGTIVPRLGFGASSKEVGLELAFFAFELFDLLLQGGDAAQGIAMTTLPISDLLSEFEVLALQALDLGTQGGHVLAEILHQGDQLRDGVTRDRDLNR